MELLIEFLVDLILEGSLEISEDEKNHVGGLYKLLEILSPTDFKAYEHGYEETLENYK